MNADTRESRRSPRIALLLDVARWGVGGFLAFGALAFLLSGREAFARFGRPDGARVALALCEIAGGLLFLFRRTLLPGAALLFGVLAWALGFHFALAVSARMLWIDLAVVILITASQLVRRSSVSGA
ncbi:MAG TPA: hypothetical protein VKJ00_04155 [Thermoanaerobaculia bacterium]|nr:hypothetical protein [Thermoanaerobaculia bacterium]